MSPAIVRRLGARPSATAQPMMANTGSAPSQASAAVIATQGVDCASAAPHNQGNHAKVSRLLITPIESITGPAAITPHAAAICPIGLAPKRPARSAAPTARSAK